MSKANRLPPLHALVAFEAAARLGGFGQAAEELCITPSAISHRIRQLESLMGEPLFERTASGARLNRAGLEYQRVVGEAFLQLSRLSRLEVSDKSPLRIGSPPTFARNLLIPALPGFYRQWPDVEIEVAIEAPLSEQPGRHDIDIRWGTAGGDGRPAVRLFDDHIVALAAPSYRAARALERPADLVRADLLRTPLLPWRPWFEAAGLDWPEPASGPQFADLGILIEAAASGMGVAACTTRLAAAWCEGGRLDRLFGVEAASPITYWLLADAQQVQRPVVAAFRDWLIERLG